MNDNFILIVRYFTRLSHACSPRGKTINFGTPIKSVEQHRWFLCDYHFLSSSSYSNTYYSESFKRPFTDKP